MSVNVNCEFEAIENGSKMLLLLPLPLLSLSLVVFVVVTSTGLHKTANSDLSL